MLSWFSNNAEAFSLIDALVKLILVITASIFIICFCHRLTNYRKIRIRRYKSNSSLNFAVASIAGRRANQATPFISSSRLQDPGSRQLMAILSAANAANLFPSYDPNLYAHQAYVEAQLQQQNPHLNHFIQANYMPGESQTSVEVTNQPENDQCPSYEEAIATQQQQQHQQIQIEPQSNDTDNNIDLGPEYSVSGGDCSGANLADTCDI